MAVRVCRKRSLLKTYQYVAFWQNFIILTFFKRGIQISSFPRSECSRTENFPKGNVDTENLENHAWAVSAPHIGGDSPLSSVFTKARNRLLLHKGKSTNPLPKLNTFRKDFSIRNFGPILDGKYSMSFYNRSISDCNKTQIRLLITYASFNYSCPISYL